MDQFGIGAAMKAAAMIYSQASRRTGRTISLVESIKEGDRLVFMDRPESERVKRLCMERGLNVECIVIDPSEPHQIMERGTSHGRTIFDHSWVERRYMLAIENVIAEIDHYERQCSGYGEAHRQTRRLAEELAKWR